VPFAPHEIENKKFVVAIRGYHTDEVDAFLRAVAADYRAALESAQPVGAEIERVVRSAREAAEQEAAEIRQAAEREAAEVRAAVQREAEACYAEISRQAGELRHIELRLRDQLHALEHTVAEGRQVLTGRPPVYGVAR
jgi:DivIVA domain-containing protein